jgi:hypothetical protein
VRVYFLVSLALHLGVFVFVWIERPLRRRDEVLQIEMKQAVAETPRLGGGARPGRRSAGMSWRELKSRGGDFGLAHELGNPHSWIEKDTSGWSPGDWGYGGAGQGIMKSIGQTLSLDKLRLEVEGLLYYPGVLGRRKVEGTINTRLVFGEDSKCDWSRTRVTGASPYLRVYIFALLKKLCAFDTMTTMGFLKDQRVDMSFRFFLVNRTTEKDHSTLAGGVLLFQRQFLVLPGEYHIGPLTGTVFAPFVSLDWPWVVEHWDQWVEHKDPLRDFRSAE